jgi:hypothetical protein
MTLPPLSNQPNVEIAQTGQWDISTGRVTLTSDDFANAIAALDCPAVRKPILKIGHTDTRFDGEPCIGWIDNLATTDSGGTIRGDYTGMPGWLGPILASSYPDRSMEATWDYVCQLGHVHPFVITAVALLGVTPPGIGTLESLQDVANLYGVNASAGNTGQSFSVTFSAKGDDQMPTPHSVEIAAGVTAEDVRRTYYETASYSVWIKEIELSPLQLITLDEATGAYSRVPITLNDSGVEFGDAIPVQVEYVDKPSTAAASRIVYASKDESRPKAMTRKVEDKLPPKDAINRVAQASGVQRGNEMDSAKIREALGLAADASDDDVLAAATALRQPPTPPTPDPAPAPVEPLSIPEGSGVVAVDRSILAKLQESAKKGEAAYAEMQKSRRDAVISQAIECGKFAPARREHWEQLWDVDPVGTEKQIKDLSAGLVPLQASGYPGTETAEQDEQYYRLFPEDKVG